MQRSSLEHRSVRPPGRLPVRSRNPGGQSGRRCWRHLASLVLALCVVGLWGRPAAAWIETEIRGYQATVLVPPAGRAEVRHELLLRVRGGPLQSLEIEGVGSELELLGDATVRSATSGAVWPLELEAGDDGKLILRIGAERGLRGGVYRFDFGYRVDLLSRGWLERRGAQVQVTWVQPRFATGIDSARVVFRVPRADAEPRLPEEDGPSSAVLLTEVRRGPDFDEVDLVRAHVAKQEPAVWQVMVPAETFPALLGSEPSSPQASRTPPRPAPSVVLPSAAWWVWLVAAALGVVYATVLALKWRALCRASAQAEVIPRGLVPMPAVLRILLAAGLLGAAAALAMAEWPAMAGACLAGAVLCAACLPPLRVAKARGPGEWVRLSSDELRRPPRRPSPGRWLDAGTLPGAVGLSGLVLITAAAAWWVLPRSPYHAGLILASSVAWLPVFLTGRASDMPADPAWGSLPLYRWLAAQLEQKAGVAVEYWGRRSLQTLDRSPEATEAAAPAVARPYDEIRLRLCPPRVLRGLRVVEIGVEIGGGLTAMPCVVVRIDDESPAYRALPRGVPWVRGRHGDERVAILRPSVPSRAQCLRIARGVLRLVTVPTEQGARTGGKNGRVRGSGAPSAVSEALPAGAAAS